MRISDWSSDVCSSDLAECKSRISNGFGDLPRRPADGASNIDHLLPDSIGGLHEQRFADRFDHAFETVELGEPVRTRFTCPVVRARPSLFSPASCILVLPIYIKPRDASTATPLPVILPP